MNIAVFGGGNGGFAAAGDLALRGHRVTLCEVPSLFGHLNVVRGTRTLHVEALPATGLPSGLAQLALVTDDAVAAVREAEVVLIIVPSYALGQFVDFLAPALRSHHLLLLMPGNLWGAYRAAAGVRAARAARGALVGEAECLIYAARKTGEGGVAIRGYKQHLGVAAADAGRTAELHERLLPLYPDLRRLDTVLQSGLDNVNPFFHPIILLSNLGLVGTRDTRRFYTDGVSATVARLIECLDGERLALGSALGVALPRLRELLLLWYAHEGAAGSSLHAVIQSVPAYRHSLFPAELATTRYLLEDIPYGLVPFTQLAERAGVQTPMAEAVAGWAAQVAAGVGATLPGPTAVDVEGFLRAALGREWRRRGP